MIKISGYDQNIILRIMITDTKRNVFYLQVSLTNPPFYIKQNIPYDISSIGLVA